MRTIVYCMMGVVFFVQLGCSPSPIHLSPNFGQSAHMAMENQIQNPTASNNIEPVQDIDGPTAKTIVEQYRESFIEDSGPPPSLILSPAGSAS